MSVLIEKEVPCTYCRFPNAVEIWSIINVKEDPELRDLLLGGELNMAECGSCKKVFFAENFLLYHDPNAELLAFVYPYAARSEKATYEEKTRLDFENLKALSESSASFSYTPVTFFGFDELIHVIEDEEEKEIQGGIVAALAPSLNIPVVSLRPSLARRQNVPQIVPGFTAHDRFGREQLLAALKTVENANHLLSVYVKWRLSVEENPAYEMRFV
jgi:hypothetical protein